MTAMDFALTCFAYNTYTAVMCAAQGLIVFTMAAFTRRPMGVWLVAVPIMWFATKNPLFRTHHTSSVAFSLMSYRMLGFISFNVDMLEGRCRPEDNTWYKRLWRMYTYTFYTPYLIAERNNVERKWTHIGFFAARMAFWFALIEFMLHFMYFQAILSSLPTLYAIGKDQLCSMGMAMVHLVSPSTEDYEVNSKLNSNTFQADLLALNASVSRKYGILKEQHLIPESGTFFHLKYVVIFGLPALFAKLDAMQPPDGPRARDCRRCLTCVVLYSKVWREFDRGLYNFFKHYIFVPICRPTFSIPRKLVGMVLAYAFVLAWHNTSYGNIVWIVLNVIELFIEIVAKSVYSVKQVRQLREAYIGDRAFRRVLALLMVLPYAISLYSTYYFLSGAETGYVFVDRILWQETINFRYPAVILIWCGYVAGNVAIDLERREKQTKSKVL